MGKERNSEIEDIHNAARSGDLLKLQSICSSNPLAVNSRDKHSRTPLHLAAWAGQTQVVTYLCKHKADVGAAAMDDMGAIHFAAQKGHLEVVRTLLSSGASVKAITRKGMTPLHYAAQGSHLDLAKYLVRKGGSLSAKSKAGKTPLDLAGSEEFRTVLVECERLSRKGDKNVKDKRILMAKLLQMEMVKNTRTQTSRGKLMKILMKMVKYKRTRMSRGKLMKMAPRKKPRRYRKRPELLLIIF
uniref:Uncharacterized protein n=1 Tax=Vitis vinifera TaxID=29760 RepID=F6I099_VITVI